MTGNGITQRHWEGFLKNKTNHLISVYLQGFLSMKSSVHVCSGNESAPHFFPFIIYELHDLLAFRVSMINYNCQNFYFYFFDLDENRQIF